MSKQITVHPYVMYLSDYKKLQQKTQPKKASKNVYQKYMF